MTSPKKPTPFNIIRVRGTPNKAHLPDGTEVERLDKLFVPELRGFIMTAPYSEHFIFEIPRSVAHKFPGSAYLCTCGSAAIYTGPQGYVLDASPQGKLFVCQAHATTGKHANGGSRWV